MDEKSRLPISPPDVGIHGAVWAEPLALRLFRCTFGTLTLIGVYRLARYLFDTRGLYRFASRFPLPLVYLALVVRRAYPNPDVCGALRAVQPPSVSAHACIALFSALPGPVLGGSFSTQHRCLSACYSARVHCGVPTATSLKKSAGAPAEAVRRGCCAFGGPGPGVQFSAPCGALARISAGVWVSKPPRSRLSSERAAT